MELRWLLTIASLIGVSACATPVQKGLTAYNQGSFDQAAAQWNGPAAQGDPAAQYNLGLLWENGLGSTPKDLNQAAAWYLKSANQGFLPSMTALARIQLGADNRAAALSWLNLAARWNDQAAIASLAQLGQPVPAPDLFNQQQALVAQTQQGLEQVGYAIGCALGGGCGRAPVQPYSPPLEIKCTPTTRGSQNPDYRCSGR